MALEDNVLKLRKEALAKRRKPVPDAYQGVTKDRIKAILNEIDRYTVDRCDTVFALLDDEHESWFTSAPTGTTFSDGASTAHIACHVGTEKTGSERNCSLHKQVLFSDPDCFGLFCHLIF